MIGESDYLTSGRRRRCVVLYPNSVCGQGDFRKKRGGRKKHIVQRFCSAKGLWERLCRTAKKVGAGDGGKQQIHFEFAKL